MKKTTHALKEDMTTPVDPVVAECERFYGVVHSDDLKQFVVDCNAAALGLAETADPRQHARHSELLGQLQAKVDENEKDSA